MWFKRAVLDADWWRKIAYHFKNTLELTLPVYSGLVPVPPGTPLSYWNDTVQVEQSRQGIVLFFMLISAEKRYVCYTKIIFDRNIQGVSFVNAPEGTRIAGAIIKVVSLAHGGETAKELGPVSLNASAITPVGVVNAILKLIDNDRRRGGGNDEVPDFDPSPTSDVDSPVPAMY